MAAASQMLSDERKKILATMKTKLSESVEGPNLIILLSEIQALEVLTKQQVDAVVAKPTPFEQMAAVVSGIITSGTEQNYEDFVETLEKPNVGLKGLGSVLRNADTRSTQRRDGHASVPMDTGRSKLDAALSARRQKVLKKLKPKLCQRVSHAPMKHLLIEMESDEALTNQEVIYIQAQSTPYDQMAEVVNRIRNGTEGHYEKLLRAMRDEEVGLALLADMLTDAENA